MDTENVRNVEQIGKQRWNHQILVGSLDDARSTWIAELIELSYDYGSG